MVGLTTRVTWGGILKMDGKVLGMDNGVADLLVCMMFIEVLAKEFVVD
jgi:hypothetical protein